MVQATVLIKRIHSVQPIRYTDPSLPRKAIRPAIEIKEAADIQSAALPYHWQWDEHPSSYVKIIG